MLNYDPDAIPKTDPDAFAEALAAGLKPIYVICDEPGAQVGDTTGVSFVAFGMFLPREGDEIVLEDGTQCRVQRVIHKVSRQPDSKVTSIVPNVYATRSS